MLKKLTPHSITKTVLSHQQKSDYERDGFLVYENFIAKEVCDLLINQAKKLIDQYDANGLKTIFTSGDEGVKRSRNLYFLNSGDKIRFFFEEGALDENGELKTEKLLAINKIGHALHDLDPIFNCFSRQHKIATLVNELGVIDPLLVQSMYLCKQPHIGDEVVCHQDSTYLYVKEQPVMGLWFALEDATLENGCLWAIPGGHRTPLKSRMFRDQNDAVSMTVYDDSPWPHEKMVPLEVPRGSLIVLHGLLPHMSKENTSPRSRHAYALHVTSGLYDYPADNWLQRANEMPFQGFL